MIFPINDDELILTKRTVLRSIKLFDDLNTSFPQGASLEQFQIFLRDRGGADQQTVIKESSKPYKLYSAISKYLNTAEPPKPPTRGEGRGGQEARRTPDGYIDVSMGGKSFLSFPLTTEGLEMLKPYFTDAFLKFLKSQARPTNGSVPVNEETKTSET